MLNTPSVTTIMLRALGVHCCELLLQVRPRRRSYSCRAAREQSLMPSIRLAWISRSLMITSSSLSSTSNTAALASKQRAEQDRRLLAEELRQLPLQLVVHVLRAADEAHAAHAVAALVEALVRRLDQLGVAGQAEVVVGAEVEHVQRRREPRGYSTAISTPCSLQMKRSSLHRPAAVSLVAASCAAGP